MIKTERLRLRPFRANDRACFHAMLNTPAMMAQLGGIRSSTEMDALFDKRIADQAQDGFSYWAVESRASRALVGTCGVRIARNYVGTSVYGLHEMGWRIAETHWGQGLGSEAAVATLFWTWANTGAVLVAAWTTAGNKASWKLMERIGMVRRPELDFHHPQRADDDPLGTLIVYAIDRPAS